MAAANGWIGGVAAGTIGAAKLTAQWARYNDIRNTR